MGGGAFFLPGASPCPTYPGPIRLHALLLRRGRVFFGLRPRTYVGNQSAKISPRRHVARHAHSRQPFHFEVARPVYPYHPCLPGAACVLTCAFLKRHLSLPHPVALFMLRHLTCPVHSMLSLDGVSVASGNAHF